MFQDIFVSVRITKGHVPKLDIPFYRFPVFGFSHKAVPIFFHHLGRILDGGHLLQQSGDPLDIGLSGDNIRQNAGDLLDRFEDTHRIGGKRRQGTDFHQTLHGQVSAAGKHQSGSDRA